jgi:aldehyde:ferredoxin oxidoreductase
MNGLLRDWHVKNSGCTGCVMNCFSTIRGRNLPQGIVAHGEAHCVQMQTGNYGRTRGTEVVSQASAETVFVAKQRADQLGVNAYDFGMVLSLLVRLRFDQGEALFQALDPWLRSELALLPWGSIDSGGDSGLSFMQALFDLFANAEPGTDTLGGWLLQGAPRAAVRFGMFDDIWFGNHGDFHGFEGFRVAYSAHGQREHFGPDRFGYPAGLHWVVWNRDPNRHEHNGLVSWSGLSWAQKRRVAEIHFGSPDAIDDPDHQWVPGPPTGPRIELARKLAVRSMLKDSLTLCDWVFPNYCAPVAEREYAGDLGLEAELYRAVTGDAASEAELDARAETLVDLYRAITVRDWNTADMRGALGYVSGGRGADQGGNYRGHDNLAAWFFVNEPHLDRDEFELAKTMFYRRMGWHSTLGSVPRAKLEAGGLSSVADGLETLGLLPPDEG